MFTALDFARKDEEWVKRRLTKPFREIWQELNGHFVLPLETKRRGRLCFHPENKDLYFPVI